MDRRECDFLFPQILTTQTRRVGAHRGGIPYVPGVICRLRCLATCSHLLNFKWDFLKLLETSAKISCGSTSHLPVWLESADAGVGAQ